MPSKRSRKRRTARRSQPDLAARERALEVLQRMRSDGRSLTRAAQLSRTSAATVRKHVGRELNRTPRGRYAVTASDRLTRRVWVLTQTGKEEVPVRGSRPASRVARHWVAVDQYLRTGNSDALQEFRGQAIRAGNITHRFLTDPAMLDRLAFAGEVPFDRLYVLRA